MGGPSKDRVDVGESLIEVVNDCPALRLSELGPSGQQIDVVAIRQVRGHPAGRGVGLAEEAQLLEGGQLVADGRRAHAHAAGGLEGLAPHGSPVRMYSPTRARRISALRWVSSLTSDMIVHLYI